MELSFYTLFVILSRNFLSDIETGKKWASPITLVKLADAFSVGAYELLKPAGIYPDNANTFIGKYTEDIFSAIKEIHDNYLTVLKQEDS